MDAIDSREVVEVRETEVASEEVLESTEMSRRSRGGGDTLPSAVEPPPPSTDAPPAWRLPPTLLRLFLPLLLLNHSLRFTESGTRT